MWDVINWNVERIDHIIIVLWILGIICAIMIVHQIKLRKEIRKLRELIQDKP